MQLNFDQSTSTIWLFATPAELLQMAAMAEKRVIEAKIGESLTIFERGVSRSNLVFKVSANKDVQSGN